MHRIRITRSSICKGETLYHNDKSRVNDNIYHSTFNITLICNFVYNLLATNSIYTYTCNAKSEIHECKSELDILYFSKTRSLFNAILFKILIYKEKRLNK